MSVPQQPVAQLESLKYRITQIMESITALQFLIDANGQPAMPSWPDILARYNLLLSQTHSLSVSLSSALAHHQSSQPQLQQSKSTPAENPFQKLALHPSTAIPEQQLDHALAPLLRNQPTVQVIKEEDTSVRRISAILKTEAPDGPERYEQVVRECAEIRRAHDARVERAVKAVALLRDRYEWRARVEAEDLDKEVEREDAGNYHEKREENGDISMKEPADENVVVQDKASTSIGSSPASENEARETEDVLGQGTS